MSKRYVAKVRDRERDKGVRKRDITEKLKIVYYIALYYKKTLFLIA